MENAPQGSSSNDPSRTTVALAASSMVNPTDLIPTEMYQANLRRIKEMKDIVRRLEVNNDQAHKNFLMDQLERRVQEGREAEQMLQKLQSSSQLPLALKTGGHPGTDNHSNILPSTATLVEVPEHPSTSLPPAQPTTHHRTPQAYQRPQQFQPPQPPLQQSSASCAAQAQYSPPYPAQYSYHPYVPTQPDQPPTARQGQINFRPDADGYSHHSPYYRTDYSARYPLVSAFNQQNLGEHYGTQRSEQTRSAQRTGTTGFAGVTTSHYPAAAVSTQAISQPQRMHAQPQPTVYAQHPGSAQRISTVVPPTAPSLAQPRAAHPTQPVHHQSQITARPPSSAGSETPLQQNVQHLGAHHHKPQQHTLPSVSATQPAPQQQQQHPRSSQAQAQEASESFLRAFQQAVQSGPEQTATFVTKLHRAGVGLHWFELALRSLSEQQRKAVFPEFLQHLPPDLRPRSATSPSASGPSTTALTSQIPESITTDITESVSPVQTGLTGVQTDGSAPQAPASQPVTVPHITIPKEPAPIPLHAPRVPSPSVAARVPATDLPVTPKLQVELRQPTARTPRQADKKRLAFDILRSLGRPVPTSDAKNVAKSKEASRRPAPSPRPVGGPTAEFPPTLTGSQENEQAAEQASSHAVLAVDHATESQPVLTTPAAPPVMTTPVVPPVITTPAAPSPITTPVALPVTTMPAGPPAITTPVAPPVITMPVTPLVIPSPTAPPVMATQPPLQPTTAPSPTRQLPGQVNITVPSVSADQPAHLDDQKPQVLSGAPMVIDLTLDEMGPTATVSHETPPEVPSPIPSNSRLNTEHPVPTHQLQNLYLEERHVEPLANAQAGDIRMASPPSLRAETEHVTPPDAETVKVAPVAGPSTSEKLRSPSPTEDQNLALGGLPLFLPSPPASLTADRSSAPPPPDTDDDGFVLDDAGSLPLSRKRYSTEREDGEAIDTDSSVVVVKKKRKKRPYVLVPPPPRYVKKIKGSRRKEGVARADGETTDEGDSRSRIQYSQPETIQFIEHERLVVKDGTCRFAERPCKWRDCDAVLNCGVNLFAHLEKHGQDDPQRMPFRCRWKGCGKKFRTNDDRHEHFKVHGIFPIPCAYAGCDQSFFDSTEAFNHKDREHGGQQSPAQPPRLPYPPAIPATVGRLPPRLPSYRVVPRRVHKARISADRHAVVGPWVLWNIFGPVQLNTKKQNVSIRGRIAADKGGAKADANRDEYDFLLPLSAGSSRVTPLDELHSSEVTRTVARGLTLWGGAMGVVATPGDDSVSSESLKVSESPAAVDRREAEAAVIHMSVDSGGQGRAPAADAAEKESPAKMLTF